MPVGGATAASSLYSGIFNSEAEAKKKPPASEAGSASEEASSSTRDASNNVGVATDSAKESSASDGTTTTAPKPQVWSAALRFAPRKNIHSSQANRSRKPAASIISSTFSAAPVPEIAAAAGVAEEKATSKAEPSQSESAAATFSSNGESLPTSTTGWTKLNQSGESSKLPLRIDALHTGDADDDARSSLPIITAPPELSIPEEELQRDVAMLAALAEKRGETMNTVHRMEQEWQEGEDEDDDVNGFTNTEAGRKAKRRRYKKKRNTSPGHHGGGPSASLRMDADYDVRVPNDYNEFKDLIRKRRQAIKQTALAREARERQRYHDNYNEMERGGESAEEEEEEEEDDDAYKRKRMNRFAPPAIYKREGSVMAASVEDFDNDDEKPYLSPPPPPLQPPAFAAPVAPPAAPPSIAAETGEEAYLRRLAMSQSQASPSAAPGPGQQAQPPSAPASIDFAARAAAAASIAAKLAKAAPAQEIEAPKQFVPSSVTSFLGSSSSSTATDSSSSSFAQRLMEKQGWKEGEALGAEGNKGLLDPILAKKVETERKKQQQLRREGGNPSDRDNRPTLSNRGTIVNSHEEEKRREEREKYGTPSEVILLENMVSLHDIDDGLSDEIGEECAKHGYVERVFIWPQGPHGVRIFVRFSGMAGAWRCVKDLDGRFFGGKVVKARYYPLHEFERGHYMRVFG